MKNDNEQTATSKSLSYYMSNLGQIIDSLHKYENEPSMQGELLDLIDEAIIIHHKCKLILPTSFEDLPSNQVEEMKHLYMHHILTSLRILTEMRSALAKNELESYKDLKKELLMNMKLAHSNVG